MDRSNNIAIAHPATFRKQVRELALCAAWHGGLTRSLVDTSGRSVNVVFPGQWSHGFGPDFSKAMIDIPGIGLLTGAVELHHNASDWINHGHHLDPRYANVILHVVSKTDLTETRTVINSVIPMALLSIPDEMLFRIDARLPDIWSDLGGDVCAETLVDTHPEIIRTTIHQLGDRRLDERVTRIEGDLQIESPHDLLTRLLFDALGYSENRVPMQQLANALNQLHWSQRLAACPHPDRLVESQSMIFGLAGYLPLSPGDAHLAGLKPEDILNIERRWHIVAKSILEDPIPATSWVRARTRPANHPATRLSIASRLLVALCNDPVGDVIQAVSESGDIVAWLQHLAAEAGTPPLGTSRARTIVANVMLPFALAMARQQRSLPLEEAAATIWQQLSMSEWSRPAKRAMHQVAGSSSLRGLGERGHQGLLKLNHDFCSPRRCFECPIAENVVRQNLRNPRH
ncbi:MAG: DUF2851 family protein [Thermomicrobiales bacterium]